MKRYEYKIIDSQLLSELNKEGEQGWQVVNYLQFQVLLMRSYEQDSDRA